MTSNINRSVQRCLSLLKAFQHGSGKTLTELSRTVNLSHSTVIRFLSTLEQEGYVRKDGTLWWLTPQMLELGFAAIESMGVTEAVQESLRSLATHFSGSANLGAHAGDHITIVGRAVDAAERRKLVIMNLNVGSTLPNDSALYIALDTARDLWTVAEYAETNTISIAITLSAPASAMALGVSMDNPGFSHSRIESEILPRLRDARLDIERLLRVR